MLPGCREVQCFTGPSVQAVGYGVEVALIELRQGRPFREVLPQETVVVLVGAALPGRVWVGKEDAPAGRLRQARMACHLLALVICQGLAQELGDRVERAHKRAGRHISLACRPPRYARQSERRFHRMAEVAGELTRGFKTA